MYKKIAAVHYESCLQNLP